ncbi:MAG: DUF2807 domain-containing protein [Anaerolineales bacterium]|nr:DUF2807 domain-containing protein [Anaerolineales bacterium]
MKKTMGIFSITALFVITACNLASGLSFKTVTGSGVVITEERQVSGFERINVCCGMELYLTQGETESLKIEADDNFMDEIVTTIDNGSLWVQYRELSNVNYQPSKPVRLYLSAVEIREVSISGGGDLNLESLASEGFELDLSGGSDGQIGTIAAEDVRFQMSGGGEILAGNLETESLAITVSGGGEFEVDQVEAGLLEIDLSGGSDADIRDLSAAELRLESSGGGRVSMAGVLKKGEINLSGGSSFNGQDLESQEITFTCSGGGRSTLRVADSLQVDLSGGSWLGYYGQPQIQAQGVSGDSELESLGGD